MEDSATLRDRYHSNGYARIARITPPEVARGLLGVIARDVAKSGVAQRMLREPTVNKKVSYEFHSVQYPAAMTFHWGLTSRMCDLTGMRLLPTYAFFRIYQKGDVCTVHSDRPSCEHSLSLALAYADGEVWSFEVGREFRTFEEAAPMKPADDFGDELHSTVRLDPGDAILYKGVNHRHGRMEPNPNRWSAHMFLHWVDADGPFAEWAFDKKPQPEATGFIFPSA
jgi:hypothetical protein